MSESVEDKLRDLGHTATEILASMWGGHDLKHCRDSNADLTGTLWPRCLAGTILAAWPQPGPVPGAGSVAQPDPVLGLCGCACHDWSVPDADS